METTLLLVWNYLEPPRFQLQCEQREQLNRRWRLHRRGSVPREFEALGRVDRDDLGHRQDLSSAKTSVRSRC